MIEAAVNKLMHDPTMQLRKLAAQNSDDVEQATAILDELFGLSRSSEETSVETTEEPESIESSRTATVSKEHLA